MLPVNPDSSQLQRQTQLESKINELNNLESWGSRDVALVSESEIQSIVEESFKCLQEHPNKSLRRLLLKLTERAKSEEHIGQHLKSIASRVHKYLEISTVLSLPEEIVPQVLNWTGMKDLSNLSVVSSAGNTIGKEAILDKIQKLGYKGTNYDDAVKYITGLKQALYSLHEEIQQFNPENFPVLDEILEELAVARSLNFQGYKTEIEMTVDVLERLKALPVEDLIGLFTVSFIYRSDCDSLRNFIIRNCATEAPLEASLEIDDYEKIQGKALYEAAGQHNIDVLNLLLKLGVAPDSKHNGGTALEAAESRNFSKKRISESGYPNHKEVVDLLTKALKKPE